MVAKEHDAPCVEIKREPHHIARAHGRHVQRTDEHLSLSDDPLACVEEDGAEALLDVQGVTRNESSSVHSHLKPCSIVDGYQGCTTRELECGGESHSVLTRDVCRPRG